ncbi:hypothetical protein JCM10908_006921 [Rhodotorula pacifica]|uniref:uncharacterized protein n=1 Tax=Rhodotorula pacifica TaxID=1495444 RepID=UPI00316D47E7
MSPPPFLPVRQGQDLAAEKRYQRALFFNEIFGNADETSVDVLRGLGILLRRVDNYLQAVTLGVTPFHAAPSVTQHVYRKLAKAIVMESETGAVHEPVTIHLPAIQLDAFQPVHQQNGAKKSLEVALVPHTFSAGMPKQVEKYWRLTVPGPACLHAVRAPLGPARPVRLVWPTDALQAAVEKRDPTGVVHFWLPSSSGGKATMEGLQTLYYVKIAHNLEHSGTTDQAASLTSESKWSVTFWRVADHSGGTADSVSPPAEHPTFCLLLNYDFNFLDGLAVLAANPHEPVPRVEIDPLPVGPRGGAYFLRWQ